MPVTHGKPPGKDHDRGRSGVHVDRAHAGPAATHGLPFSVAERAGAGGVPESNTGTASITGSARGFTRCEPVTRDVSSAI